MKETIIGIIRNETRHINYDYIVGRTKKWRALVSGEGIDELMERFNQRESDEQFAQRKRITQQITSSVCKNVRDIEYKVPRSNSITKVVATDSGKEGDLKDFTAILNEFWGDSTLDDYMDTRWIELNDTDPNSFIVIEWGPFEEDEHAMPYPFEVKSEEAIMYEYDNNVLQYLVALTGDTFTGYWPDSTIQLKKITDEEILKTLKFEDGEEREMMIADTVSTVIRIKDDYYTYLEFIPHKLGYVPAYQPGYMRDLATDGHSFLPPWWAAESVLISLIKSKSELDLTVALHVFPQKFVYTPRCKQTGCNMGEMPDGSSCSHCKGTGWEIEHTTAQDIVRLALPKLGGELFDLEKLVHYEYPPVDLITFMDDYVDKLSQRAIQFVYNSEIYSREQVAETATGKNIDMQAVYDTLYPLAKAMSRDWEFMVETISDITQIEVTASFTFGKDFKLKSLDGYYSDLSIANTAGASSYVKSSIEDDIARIQFAEDKQALAKYFTLKAFHPFPGEASETIALKMTQQFTPVFYKVLYSSFGFIFDELERDNNGFYMMNRAKQWELLKAKVEGMIPAAPVITPFPKV